MGEPQPCCWTNRNQYHLDIEMLGWLEALVNDFDGAALIVSHDGLFSIKL
ncbi:MAG: hypothetical protein R3C44_16920 [Chloroflexota bacterium]